MIDKVYLNKEIRDIAARLFSDITSMSPNELEDNLRHFAEKSKDIAESILDEYSNAKFEYYTEGVHAITDIEVLKKFVDFNTGYKQQMLIWMSEHKPEIKEEYFDIDDSLAKKDIPINIEPKVVLGVGTVIAVGLFIFTNIWIALAAEMLAIALAVVQRKRIAKNKTQVEIEYKRYTLALIAKKDMLVNGMIKELERWLEEGEAHSESVIKSFCL